MLTPVCFSQQNYVSEAGKTAVPSVYYITNRFLVQHRQFDTLHCETNVGEATSMQALGVTLNYNL